MRSVTALTFTAVWIVLFAPAATGAQVRLPEPRGSHAVGVATVTLTDSTRPDPATGAPRTVAAVVWYPATAGTGQPAPYLNRLEARRTVLGEAFVDAAGTVLPNARADAEPAGPGPFPVVLISHSLGGLPGLYAGLGEELASRGYIVASVGHPGGAGALWIDGRVVEVSPVWERNDPAQAGVQVAFAFRDSRTRVWVEDVLFVLSRLPGLKVGSTARVPVDTGSVGYIGHSVGGSAAALGCALSQRFDACVNLDGWPLADTVAEDGLTQPYLHVEETRPYRSADQLESWAATRAEYDRNMALLAARKDSLFQTMRGPAYHVVVDGLSHAGFADSPLWLAADREAQTLAPERALAIVRSWVGWFLDRHVRQQPVRPPDPASYPEVRFTAYGAAWSQDRPGR